MVGVYMNIILYNENSKESLILFVKKIDKYKSDISTLNLNSSEDINKNEELEILVHNTLII